MKSVSSRIWTRVTVSISYDDNHYTTVRDASLLNTQRYKVRIKDKVEQPKERSSTLPYTSVW